MFELEDLFPFLLLFECSKTHSGMFSSSSAVVDFALPNAAQTAVWTDQRDGRYQARREFGGSISDYGHSRVWSEHGHSISAQLTYRQRTASHRSTAAAAASSETSETRTQESLLFKYYYRSKDR